MTGSHRPNSTVKPLSPTQQIIRKKNPVLVKNDDTSGATNPERRDGERRVLGRMKEK